jgi:glycosyltransferase involved in cell wall biosynthesis
MSVETNTICQITTVHPRYDVRIFQKICTSLASEYKVNLIVADGKGDEEQNNIRIYDVGLRESSRFKRFLFTSYKAYKKALDLNNDVYHFHDPEFLFCALKLRNRGKTVIYDVHEDVPKQTLSKDYINPVIRILLASLIKISENYISARLFAVITVTQSISERFKIRNKQTNVINNYPFIHFEKAIPYSQRFGICYVGIISRGRGIKEIIQSIENIDVILNLAGEFDSEEFKADLLNLKSWSKVVYHGAISFDSAVEIIRKSKIGMVTFLPEPNHISAQPNKMFEYMSASLPVIASDFPLWRQIIEGNNCGICVDPGDPVAISKAVLQLLENPDLAELMGKNGAKAVLTKYNWDSEKLKLAAFYKTIFK